MKRIIYLAFLLFAPPLVHAQSTLTQIAYRNDPNAFIEPQDPILGNGGVAYWHDAGPGTNGGERILSYPGGQVAADTRTTAVAGDYPVGIPQDTYNGKVLVQGRYFEDLGGGGFNILSTLVEYPGGADLVSSFSSFPGGIPSNDTIQIGQGLYDNDGTIVFGIRQIQSSILVFTAMARYSSLSGITILVKSGVTPMPDGTNIFTSVGTFSTGGGTIFFYGAGGGKKGLYQLSNGTITKVLEDTDPWPAGVGTVSIYDFYNLSFANEGQDVAVALTDSLGAVFKRIGGIWSLVAKDGDSIPNGTGIFFNMGAPSIHGGKVMFNGYRNNPFALPLQLGIYVESAGGITPVVDLNANFDGIAVTSLLVPSFGGRYWDGQKVAFNVSDTGISTRANYIAVPGATTTNSLRISSFDLQGAGGTPRLSFQTINGVSYHIQQSSNLADWVSVTQFTGDGSTKTVTNLMAVGHSQFYRVTTP